MELQALNASFPILVTETGMVTFVRATHLSNALFPMAVNLSVNTISFSSEQSLNESSPIVLTDSSRTTFSTGASANISLNLSAHDCGTVASFKELQSANTLSPIVVTAVGITISVRKLQALNASLPIPIRESGSEMLSIVVADSNALSNILFVPAFNTTSLGQAFLTVNTLLPA